MPPRGEPDRRGKTAAATARLMGKSMQDAARYAFLHLANAGAACKTFLSTATGMQLVSTWDGRAALEAKARRVMRNMPCWPTA